MEARAKTKARQMLNVTPTLDIITMSSEIEIALDKGGKYKADEYSINELLSNLSLGGPNEHYIGWIRECAYYEGIYAP